MSKRVQLGMAMFLIAEGVFFFLLILAFVYFQAMPHLIASRSLVFAGLLVLSTFTISRASSGSRLWLWTTLALGAGFLIEQAVYAGTTFFILAGIHGLHLLAGMIAAVLVPSSGLRAVALYWYFFAGVWVVVLIAAYFRGAL